MKMNTGNEKIGLRQRVILEDVVTRSQEARKLIECLITHDAVAKSRITRDAMSLCDRIEEIASLGQGASAEEAFSAIELVRFLQGQLTQSIDAVLESREGSLA